ncbi:hypothetical protein L1987_24185 [Smallanthus sonchifolius]|uniref:Uncharacterized protein n=1 Tax=Smallanthus sonchifolius TaxID=185202 RepID=A0ACB9IKB7_9ASTR|nr:hypothetical protein L1987_24185 [Smallanthus sonchifolius]
MDLRDKSSRYKPPDLKNLSQKLLVSNKFLPAKGSISKTIMHAKAIGSEMRLLDSGMKGSRKSGSGSKKDGNGLVEANQKVHGSSHDPEMELGPSKTPLKNSDGPAESTRHVGPILEPYCKVQTYQCGNPSISDKLHSSQRRFVLHAQLLAKSMAPIVILHPLARLMSNSSYEPMPTDFKLVNVEIEAETMKLDSENKYDRTREYSRSVEEEYSRSVFETNSVENIPGGYEEMEVVEISSGIIRVKISLESLMILVNPSLLMNLVKVNAINLRRSILGQGFVKCNSVNIADNVVIPIKDLSDTLDDNAIIVENYQSHFNQLFQNYEPPSSNDPIPPPEPMIKTDYDKPGLSSLFENDDQFREFHSYGSKLLQANSEGHLRVFTIDSSNLNALATRLKVLNDIKNCTIDESLDSPPKESSAEKKSKAIRKEKYEVKGILGQDERKTFKVIDSKNKS